MCASRYARAPPTLEELAKEVDRLKRRRTRDIAIPILLTFGALAVALIAFLLWNSINTANDNAQDGRLNALELNMTDVQSNMMQFIVELNGNVTVLQTGNVSWALTQTAQLGAEPNCFNPDSYVHQSAEALLSTYEVQNIQIGLLNFTVLLLNPPPEALVYTSASDIDSLVHICVVNFSPMPDILTLNPTGITVHEFTHPNMGRLSTSPDCLASGDCFVVPFFIEQYVGTGAFSITSESLSASSFYIQWFYEYPGDIEAELGNTYDISEPLRLLLPSA